MNELKHDLDNRSNLEKEAQKRLKESEREREEWTRPKTQINLEDQ